MSGPKLFETRMGQRFYEGDIPRLVRALERIAEALETLAQGTTPQEAQKTHDQDSA